MKRSMLIWAERSLLVLAVGSIVVAYVMVGGLSGGSPAWGQPASGGALEVATRAVVFPGEEYEALLVAMEDPNQSVALGPLTEAPEGVSLFAGEGGVWIRWTCPADQPVGVLAFPVQGVFMTPPAIPDWTGPVISASHTVEVELHVQPKDYQGFFVTGRDILLGQ